MVGWEHRSRPLSGALGAEILNGDLARLDEPSFATIKSAFLEHAVVFFRDQDLSPAKFLAFSRRFGKPVEYPFVTGLDEAPEVHHPDPVDLIRLTPAGLSAEMVRAGFDVDYSGGLGNRLVAFLLLLEGSNVVSKILVRVLVIVLSPFIANIEARDAWSDWSANAVAVGHKRVNAGR